MKLKATVVASLLLAAPCLHAFSLDFGSLVGSSIPGDLTVNVPGYGDVAFSAGFNGVTGTTSSLEVGTVLFGAPSLQFNNGDTVSVKFLGNIPDLGSVDWGKLSVFSDSGEFAIIQTSSSEFTISLQNSSSVAGIVGASFTANSVPEPSAALLGLVGTAGLLIRRRR